jgi:cytochrome b561
MAAMKPNENIRWASALSWKFTAAVCAVGIAGLLRDSWPGPVHGSRINLHAAFGSLLWLLAVAQFRHHLRDPASPDEVDRDPPWRQSSRTVYLALYVVFGAQQLIRAGVWLWNRVVSGSFYPAAVLQPAENLRDFLAYGIIVLVTIRVLAAMHSPALKRAAPHSALPHLQHYK